MMKQLPTPTSAREARERIRDLTADIQNIERQLADTNKVNELGRRLSSRQYNSWRKNAISAMSVKLAQKRETEQWLKDFINHVLTSAMELESTDCESLLRACYSAHEKIRRNVDVRGLGADVVAVMDIVRDHVIGTA